MFGFNKNLLSRESGLTLEVPVPDFIPYACHYDGNTILTRNGELLQVIKITGFSHETVDGKKVALRDTVRKAILENIKDTDFALWFHTVRRKRNLDTGGLHHDKICNDLHNAWVKKHYWNDKYVNELYVTIIHEGQRVNMLDPKGFMHSLSLKGIEKVHDEYLIESHQKLSNVVDKMLETLVQYGAQRLGVIEEKDGVYSEMLQFFGKIIHLAEAQMPLPLMDLSHYLATHKIAFGNNTIEVRGATGKHFSAILSIKEYHELSNVAIDKFLQLPQQFVVTQTLDFINSKDALASFDYQDYVLSISGDEKFRHLSGIDEIVKGNTGASADYGEHQLTIMLIADDLKKLDAEIKRSMGELYDLGIVTVREDMFIEDCFWSQLPSNFSYISRKRPINTARIAGFSSLHNFPAGRQDHNHWGDAITIFRTALGTPYFFNFHDGANGHTVIIGPRHAGKTVLMNFFISEARKFNTKLFFLDQHRASKVFIKALGGNYIVTAPTSPTPEHRFNPLLLPDTTENRHFLQQWMTYLLTTSTIEVSEEERQLIAVILQQLYQLPAEDRQLSAIAHWFGDDASLQDENSLRSRLAPWVTNGRYASLFNNPTENMDWNSPIWGADVSQLLENPSSLLGPVLSYYFHRINQALDSTPAMIVIDEAWSLLDNQFFNPQLESWFDFLQQHNAIIILASESIEQVSRSKITRTIMEKIATQIYLPNPQAGNVYREVFGLSLKEFALLNSMKLINRHFLLKQANEAIVGELNLIGMKGLIAVLSGNDESVAVMEEAIEQAGPNPDDWLPVFYNRYTASA